MGPASPAVAGDLVSITMKTIRAAATKTPSTGVIAPRLGAHRGPSGPGRLLNAGVMRPSPPRGERGALLISPGLLPVLEGHVVGADQLVAPRLPGHPPIGAVEVHLLVERDGQHFLNPQVVDAMYWARRFFSSICDC